MTSAMGSLNGDGDAFLNLAVVEEKLGYKFTKRELLLTALTHRSYCHENNTTSGDFDELEWLGDSVLQLAISSWLFSSVRGAERSSGQLSRMRQRFVDAYACKSFTIKLDLLPHLRIGNGQPVEGTKIPADCFEAVLGAVYLDAGDCTDLTPIHGILARVIPSYQGATRAQHPRHGNHGQLHRHDAHTRHSFDRGSGREDLQKLMNLAHRLEQMAIRVPIASGAQGQSTPPGPVPQRSPQEAVREFHERLRDFEQNFLRGGALSFATPAFERDFGADAARFLSAAAADPLKRHSLDAVLDNSYGLRRNAVLGDAPPTVERVVMEVVLVPKEVRRQFFVVVEYLLDNILKQRGQSAQGAMGVIQAMPDGHETVDILSRVVTETSTSLLLTSKQRDVLSGALSGSSSTPGAGTSRPVSMPPGAPIPHSAHTMTRALSSPPQPSPEGHGPTPLPAVPPLVPPAHYFHGHRGPGGGRGHRHHALDPPRAGPYPGHRGRGGRGRGRRCCGRRGGM